MVLKSSRFFASRKYFFAILLLALILRVLFIWSRNLGNDEPYAVDWISNGITHFLQVSAIDTSPPLFYFMAFIANSLFGLLGFYLLAIFFGLLTIAALYFLVKLFFGEKIALLAAFLLAINPMHILYSQHLRPYSFMQFIVLAGIYFGALYKKSWKNKHLVLLSFFFLLSALTYYPAVIPFVLVYAWIFIAAIRGKKNILPLVFSFIPAPAAFLLLNLFFGSRISAALAHKYYFPLIENFFYFFYKHFAAVNVSSSISMFPIAIILGVLMCILFAFGFYELVKAKKYFFISLILGSMAIYYCAYLKFSSILYFKHMSAVMPLIFIFPAVALYRLYFGNRTAFFVLLLAIAVFSLATTGFYYFISSTVAIWTPLIGH